jgi:hypothetical protein
LAESPLATLVRVLGGVVLTQGNLGHQVLGQLLVANTNEVALAGAFVVYAGTTGQKSTVGQMALRTVAPAIAVRTIIDKREDRLERTEARIKRKLSRMRSQNRRLARHKKQLLDDLAYLARLSAL